jgi:hypothetical protein
VSVVLLGVQDRVHDDGVAFDAIDDAIRKPRRIEPAHAQAPVTESVDQWVDWQLAQGIAHGTRELFAEPLLAFLIPGFRFRDVRLDLRADEKVAAQGLSR